MGGRKRSSESIEANEEVQRDLPSKEQVGPTSAPESLNPMERRKRRKELSKERHRLASETRPQEPELEPEPEPERHVGPAETSGGAPPKLNIDVFNHMGSSDSGKRAAAAKSMVKDLGDVQRAYEGLENKGFVEGGLKLEAEKDDGMSQCDDSVGYALRRLIRGVSSSRECSRQGFAVGLTVLIETLPSIKVESLLKLIVDYLKITSSMKGLEQRDCFLGRLFCYGALARSGRLTKEWVSDHNTPYIKEFTSTIISLAAKKRYLQDPGVSVILEMTDKLPVEAVLTHVLEAPGLAEWFSEATEVGNPDALFLALKLREKTSIDSPVFGKLLPVPFCPNKLFSSEHLSSLATCLKESTFCQPRVHGVWPVLVNILLPDSLLQAEDVMSVPSSSKKHKKNRKSSSSEDEEIAKNLQCFIEVIIEGSLLLSSHDRKHLAVHVILLLLPRLPASFVSIVLSYKLVQCLMDILSTKDSWLYKVGQHFLSVLSDWVKNDDVKKVAVIVALQKHSHGKFDCITRTKTVKDLMTNFETESECMLFIQNLQDMFVDESHSSEEPSDQSQTTDDNSEMGSNEDKDSVIAAGNSDFLKIWIVESLSSVLKCSKLDLDAKFRIQKEILKFLAIQGVFTASLGTEVTSFELQEKFRWPKGATSSSVCKVCIEQLQLLLSNGQKVDGSRATPSNDLGSYFMRFISTLRNIPSISLFRPLEDEEENVLKSLQMMETSLSKEEMNCGGSSYLNRLYALRHLLIQLLLQILLRPKEFSEAASELIICCKKAFPALYPIESSPVEDENDDAAPAVMDVLVDTLLSLLPQSSAPMRTSIEQVFKYFCDVITDDGLLQMLRVIRKSLKPARHQVAESDNDDDEDEEDGEDFLDIEEDEAVIDNGETGPESEEQTDDSEAVVGTEEAVQKEASEASDDESDGGMDDDAMFRMDTYLAQIFKERKNQAGSETAQFQLLQFKLRVLSLLELYLHENPGRAQVLLVYSNLARTLVNPQTAESSEQLAQRIWGIIQKKIFKAKDYPKGEDVQLPTLESLLQKSLKLASKPIKKKKLAGKKQSAALNRQKMVSSLARDSAFWILKIIDSRNFPESELEKVFDIFRGVLEDYFGSKKSQMKIEFLREIFRRRPWIGRGLFGFLLEKCASSKSDFRRVEALDLVIEIMKPVGPAEGNGQEKALKDLLKSQLSKLSRLVEVLMTTKAEKQSRRSEVRKFCGKIFQTLSTVGLMKSLDQNARALFESQFGDRITSVKK